MHNVNVSVVRVQRQSGETSAVSSMKSQTSFFPLVGGETGLFIDMD